MSIKGYFKQTIEHIKVTPPAKFGADPTEEIIGTYLGRLRPLGGHEVEALRKRSVIATHRLYCTKRTIDEKDIVKIEGNTYEVRFVKDPMSFGMHLEIDLELIK